MDRDTGGDIVQASESAVERILTPSLLLETVEATLVEIADGSVLSGAKAILELDDADGRRAFLALPGVLTKTRIAGVKWVGSFARNPARGLPRAPATILLSDAVTGRLIGLVAATALTARRTAAMATIAAKYCADPAASRAAILGFGAIGRAAVPLLALAFGIREFQVWGGDASRLREAARSLSAAHGIPIGVAGHVAEAVAGADIVLTASGLSGDAPFLRRTMVKDGAFVCALGSFQEIDTDLIAAASLLVVDNWEASVKRGNLAPAIKTGLVTRASIRGELAEVAAGRVPGRGAGEELAVACLLGMGGLDVALAAKVIEAMPQAE